MEKIGQQWTRSRDGFRNDENFTRARRGFVQGVKALPKATSGYIVDKFPIVRWLPNYSTKWIFPDVVAGITVGLLLIPQALAYAALAQIPLQDGLLASWLPGVIYALMGTTKGKLITLSRGGH